jgi:Uma2 family endonuclease
MSAVLEMVKPQTKRPSQIIYDVSWDEYEELLAAYLGKSFPRFNYNDGVLEVVMPNSVPHEEENRTLARLFEFIAVELEIDFRNFGSATFKKKDVRKGVEPDSCFYIQSVKAIEGRRDFTLEDAPPPDLIIEADVTSSSLPRFPIFAALGVPEVWRFDSNDEQVRFYRLENGKYREIENSLAIPILTSRRTTEFLEESRALSSTAWAKRVREWTRGDERETAK